MTKKQEEKLQEIVGQEGSKQVQVPRNLVGAIADEVAKTLIQRLPGMLPKRNSTPKKEKKEKKAEGGLFLDTSAIIDGRIFDVVDLGLLSGYVVVTESVLLELKHIADSQDNLKKTRGRKGLDSLHKLKKNKFVKLLNLSDENLKNIGEVDERLIKITKEYKGRLVTCDYNLEKKASIGGVTAVNVHNLAQRLKIAAVPGENLNVQILHVGKDPTQGVGYLEDGTMVVVEKGNLDLGKNLQTVVAKVIQTSSGRILFAKKKAL